MTLHSDHKALAFVGAVALLGGGVRFVRAARGEPRLDSQPALERQMRAADSALARTKPIAGGIRGRGSGGRSLGAIGSRGGSRPDTSRVQLQDTSRRRRPRTGPLADTIHAGAGPLDRAGYVNGKLDLDVATAAQIDSLPGVTPTMAKRIVMDRMVRGPFLNSSGLRRVSGVGPAFLQHIDSLVTYSGTYRRPDPKDTVIVKERRARVKK